MDRDAVGDNRVAFANDLGDEVEGRRAAGPHELGKLAEVDLAAAADADASVEMRTVGSLRSLIGAATPRS
jgi:hypothetical protein